MSISHLQGNTYDLKSCRRNKNTPKLKKHKRKKFKPEFTNCNNSPSASRIEELKGEMVLSKSKNIFNVLGNKDETKNISSCEEFKCCRKYEKIEAESSFDGVAEFCPKETEIER